MGAFNDLLKRYGLEVPVEKTADSEPAKPVVRERETEAGKGEKRRPPPIVEKEWKPGKTPEEKPKRGYGTGAAAAAAVEPAPKKPEVPKKTEEPKKEPLRREKSEPGRKKDKPMPGMFSSERKSTAGSHSITTVA